MPFTDTCTAYAATLRAAGFTVYEPVRQSARPVSWFHYSREVDGRTCYGTYSDGSDGFNGPYHSMPITPSRLNGSGAHIGARWGDDATLNLDAMPTESVEYAEAVARPSNWCPWNYPATLENTRRANEMRPMPRNAPTGVTLSNAAPWGIGAHYVPTA